MLESVVLWSSFVNIELPDIPVFFGKFGYFKLRENVTGRLEAIEAIKYLSRFCEDGPGRLVAVVYE